MNDMQFLNVKTSSELLNSASLIGVKELLLLIISKSIISALEKSRLLFLMQADMHPDLSYCSHNFAHLNS